MKIEIENLKAQMQGFDLNIYQRADALIEFNKLLDYVKELEQLAANDYWETRCKLMEQVEENNPCDPDITNEQIEAWNKYHNFMKERGQR